MSPQTKTSATYRAVLLGAFALVSVFGPLVSTLAAEGAEAIAPAPSASFWQQLLRDFMMGETRVVERLILVALAWALVQTYTVGHRERDVRETELKALIEKVSAAVAAGTAAAADAADATRAGTAAALASTAAFVEAQRGCREHQKVIVDALIAAGK
jgi:hypothetical protein